MTKSLTMSALALCAFVLPAAALAIQGKGEGAEAAAMFKMMDANSDGKVSADEHHSAAKTMFTKMDADKDGKVTAAEMEAAHGKMPGAKAHKGKSEMNAAEKIKVVDANHDGVVTAEEHEAGAKSMFTAMDTNNDGQLDKAECEAGHAKLMHKPQAK